MTNKSNGHLGVLPKERPHPALFYTTLVVMGPLTLVHVLRGDIETKYAATIAGLIGSVIWYRIIIEVMMYVLL